MQSAKTNYEGHISEGSVDDFNSYSQRVGMAKQKASVSWIIQKAHKNKVPGEFKDPYYKDYEGQEHLKPNIVHRLANADFYCSALANIYGDPSFHNLSHWNIIQALARKGVYVAEPTDIALTETVLIQTTPLKMSAHLAVIEAMMALYIREVVIAERVVQSMQRIAGPNATMPTPQDQEEALVLWIDYAARNLQHRIHQQEQQPLPVFPKIQDLSDLIDGIGLCALISHYCPLELNWEDIAVADPPSMADSLYNIGLVIRFCQDSLPYNPCLLTREDVVYMHSSVKQNLLGFVAELFFLFELEPVSVVAVTSTRRASKSQSHSQLSSPGMKAAGVRRSHSMNLTDVPDHQQRGRGEVRADHAHSVHSDHGGRESSMSDGQEEFVVQRARGYQTLSDMIGTQSAQRVEQPAYDARALAKEKYNSDTKEEELGERGRLSRRGSFRDSSHEINALPPAGLPTKSEEKRLYGRSRSRRNSINADESQLTIENFGGSQDNLNYIGRNPDKESYTHSGRREPIHNIGSSRDVSVERRDLHRPSIDDVDKYERDQQEREKYRPRYSSSDSDLSDPEPKAAPVAPPKPTPVYAPHSDEDNLKTKDKKTTFAALPNQTTWKQQSQTHYDKAAHDENPMEPQVMSSELHNVRIKLEEKRRRIENEKRKVEVMMNKQRQKLGKEAFMQAVVKGDLGNEVSNVSKKWLEHAPTEELRTPDLDAMNYDEYQNSISQMTDSLTDIHTDIQRLSQQQNQIQNLMHNGMPPSNLPSHPHNQFYLHDQQMNSPARRMWGQQQPQHQQQQPQLQSQQHPQQPQHQLHQQQQHNDGYASMSPAPRRTQWGPPARPMLPPQGEYMMGGPTQPGYYPQYHMPRPLNPNQHQLPPINQMAPPPNQGGFMLHGQPQSLPAGHQPNMYPNGQHYYNPEQYRPYPNQPYPDQSRGGMPNQMMNAPFRLHNTEAGNGYTSLHTNPAQPPPQPSTSHQSPPQPPVRQQKSPSPSRQTHAPVAAPPPDDMEPQKVDFIDNKEAAMSDKIKRLSISSGSRTYRIHEQGSPTRPVLGTKTYRVPTKKGLPVHDDADLPEPSPRERSLSPPPYQPPHTGLVAEPLQEDKADKGFYISFEDDTAPKRPKPQLRPRKMSRKSSNPTTPASTPSTEQPPPIPERSRGGTRDSIPNEYSSLKRMGSRTSYPTAITPSSSASSISPPPPQARDTPWGPTRPYTRINNNDKKTHDYNRSFDPDSDDASDLTDDGSRLPAVRTGGDGAPGIALTIDNPLENENEALSEMEKKKEKLMMMSMRRKQQQEEAKRKHEMEAEEKREADKLKDDLKLRKKQEEKARRELILERHKIKKAIEEAEKEGRYYSPPAWYYDDSSGTATPTGKSSSVRMRHGRAGGAKPRPKTMHEATFADPNAKRPSSRAQRGSTQNIAALEAPKESNYLRKTGRRWGSSTSLTRASGSRGSTGSLRQDSISANLSRPIDRSHTGRRADTLSRDKKKPSLYGSRDTGMYEVHEVRRPSLAVDRPRPPNRRPGFETPASRKYRSTGNLYGTEQDSLMYHMSEDSGLGRATPPRRAPSPGMSSRHYPSHAGPGSLPPGLFSRRRPGAFDDNASDISVGSSNMDYCGPRLFKQPTSKSNRPIIQNAVEHCVFPGVVNQTAKQRVMQEISRSEAKYFLFLFRDSGCQFRAIYAYDPETEDVDKIYGTGPKQVTDTMFEKFFKYNSGGKCFSQIHTKHLTVTIDAFTIYNSLWQGKRVNLPSKRDMKLVI